jgi:hypothetical protein
LNGALTAANRNPPNQKLIMSLIPSTIVGSVPRSGQLDFIEQQIRIVFPSFSSLHMQHEMV